MKKIFLLFLPTFFAFNLMAQNVGIGTDTPDPSAKLHIQSNNMGILIPQLDLDTVIFPSPGPATGLMVWNTNASFADGIGFYYNFGTSASASWLKVADTGSSGTTADSTRISDQDGDTKILVEETADNDSIRFFTPLNGGASTEFFNMSNGRLGVSNTGKSIFIGKGAGANDDLSNNQNVFIGEDAGSLNTTGYWNTAIGNYSLYSNTTGFENTANSYFSLYNNTTGHSNTAIGNYSLYSNTTGYRNTANGFQSLFYNTTGYRNTANGNQSLSNNNTGINNVANGFKSLEYNTTGSNNTAVGSLSGNSGINNSYTGSNNTFIGYSTYPSVHNLTNATAIGANAVVSQSNALILGDSADVGIGTSTPSEKLDVVGNIEVSGYIKAPNWPAFNVYNTPGGDKSTTGIFDANVVVFDNGNNFNLTTNRFTAPVNGIYQFNWTCYSNVSGGRTFLYVNGAYVIQTNSNDKSISITLKLNSGDTVWLGGNGYAMTWYGGVGHNSFSGHLIKAL